MQIGNRNFDAAGHTYIMGIVNMTPDSFSDGGQYNNMEQALARVEQMIVDGVDIIDIGGESTRPGYTKLSDDEEIARVVPFIEAVKKRFDIPVSLDTYKSGVAKAGLDAGVDLINDIWGLKYDPKMAEVIAAADAACCLMHNREEAVYEDLIPDICKDLQETLKLAETAGIDRNKIMLDPGVGFGKTYQHNLSVLKHLEDFQTLGYPILLGASRKSVIGLTLDVPVTERLIGTTVTSVCAAQAKCAFVRVHDVKANRHAIEMAEAIMHAE